METNIDATKKDNPQVNVDSSHNTKKEKGDNTHNTEELKREDSNNKPPMNPGLATKVTTEDLKSLCDHLSSFNKRIQTARDIIHYRYELPLVLRDKLEEEAGELECLYLELQNAANNIEIIRNQRVAVNQEKLCLNNQLNRLKDDAIQEMEVIVSVYDAPMKERWETVKNNNSIQETENFLHDVKGKLEAMKNLQVLASQKLADLNKQDKKGEDVSKKDKKRINKERGNAQSRSCRSSTSNIANSSQLSLSLLLDTDSDETLDDGVNGMSGVLYNLVREQVLNMPSWSQGPMDID